MENWSWLDGIYVPLLLPINEAVSSVEECEVIHVLDIALLKVGVDTILLPQEVQRIKSFSLCFTDRWYVRVARELTESHKVSPAVLEENPLRCGFSGGLMEQQRPLGELLFGVLFKSEPICISIVCELK